MTSLLTNVLRSKNQPTGLIFKDLFNPLCADYIENPYAYYAAVREQCPIYKTPYGVYVLTRYKDIQMLLVNKQITKDYWGPLENIYGKQCYHESGFSLISKWLINKNPPAHTQIRKLLLTALCTKKISYLHHIVASIANVLIDQFVDKHEADLVTNYAYKLPALVIYHLLGIPESDHPFLFQQGCLPNVLLDPRCLPRHVLDDANTVVNQLEDYFAKLCYARQKNLGDDLISLLLIARKDEQINLSDAELISNIFFLFGAGHETTMNLIANGLYTLHKYPESLQLLKSNWDLLPQAIEEILRFEAPVQVASPNIALEEIEINGYCIPKSAIIMPILGAACRDPLEYQSPDQFDITRNNKSTLAFGFGIHLCLGAQLARIEGGIAIRSLLERIPHLKIDSLGTPKWQRVMSVRGLTHLMARW